MKNSINVTLDKKDVSLPVDNISFIVAGKGNEWYLLTDVGEFGPYASKDEANEAGKKWEKESKNRDK